MWTNRIHCPRTAGHLNSGYSPNTLCVYAYDLRQLAAFPVERHLDFGDCGPSTALEFLGFLRRVPSCRLAQRLAAARAELQQVQGAARAGAREESDALVSFVCTRLPNFYVILFYL